MMMKNKIGIAVLLGCCFFETFSQVKLQDRPVDVSEIDNAIFRHDPYWRGADGASAIALDDSRILWMFGDSFIDVQGTYKRSNSILIRNSIAIQEGKDIEDATMEFHYREPGEKPEAFFKVPGDTWLWPGHGVFMDNRLIIFLFEQERTTGGLGFQSVGWRLVVVDNLSDDPLSWVLAYYKGPDPLNILVGSSAVLKDSKYIYAYGVQEPATHEVYLIRFDIIDILRGDFSSMAWWDSNTWVRNRGQVPDSAVLFTGQTEFSVHYEERLDAYMQIQTYGFGHAELGYRLASKPQGPWSNPVIFYKPQYADRQEFAYSAKAHPELLSKGILITYNVNSFDFGRLVQNEGIYFPKFVLLRY